MVERYQKWIILFLATIFLGCIIGIIFFDAQIAANQRTAAILYTKQEIYRKTIQQMEETRKAKAERIVAQLEREAEIEQIHAAEIAAHPEYNIPATESAYAYDITNPKVMHLVDVLNAYPCGVYITDAHLLAVEADVECGAVIQSDTEVSLFFWSVLWRLKSGRFDHTIDEIIAADSQYTPVDLTTEPSPRMLRIAIDVIEQYARYVNGDQSITPALPEEYYYFNAEMNPEQNGWHNYYYRYNANGEREYFNH